MHFASPLSCARLLALLAVLGVAVPVAAQDPDTREGAIAQAEAAKAQNLPPATETKAERVSDVIDNFLTPKPHGWYPYLDSVYSGGGFTLGAGYSWAYHDQATYAVQGLYSIKNYKLIEARAMSPGHLNGKLTLGGVVGWRDITQAAYYGLGMSSTIDDRTNFGFDETYAQGDATLRASDWTLLAGTVAFEDYNLGSPSGARSPSIFDVHTPATAPGLGVDTTYVHTSGTAAIDWRTSPGYSRTGGYYGVTLHDYANTNGDLDFNRLDGEVIQHFPILRETWVFSVRGLVQTSLGDDTVPYFLLPSLGSGSTLRAYSSWRFRDRNSMLTQAEFRWIPNRLAMDMAIFYDAGKVTSRAEDFSFKGLAHDWGIGVRFHGPTAVPLRIEVARGSEGINLVFSGKAAF